jgi:lysophospholipase L1-like esterase
MAVSGELILRLKHANQKNYTIEMWRYAKELKQVVPDEPALGHVHIPGSSATLQNIDMQINSLGMRGPEPSQAASKTVLLLGSSITLGWGVSEAKTLRSRLDEKLGGDVQVLNGGVGNYNVTRSLHLYEKKWRAKTKPDLIVVHFFVNDAEYLPPSQQNIIIRNSQLAVTLYYIFQNYFGDSGGLESLVKHYKQVYSPDARGYQEMKVSLKKLDDIAKQDGARVVLTMIPDIHQLESYPFTFIHQNMRALADENGWAYLDFLPSLKGYKGPELWTIQGDPHPNGIVHNIMAEELAKFIELNGLL